MKSINLLVAIALSSAPAFVQAGESKEKIKEAAVAVKNDTKSFFAKAKDKVKASARKVKAKVHEETK